MEEAQKKAALYALMQDDAATFDDITKNATPLELLDINSRFSNELKAQKLRQLQTPTSPQKASKAQVNSHFSRKWK